MQCYLLFSLSLSLSPSIVLWQNSTISSTIYHCEFKHKNERQRRDRGTTTRCTFNNDESNLPSIVSALHFLSQFLSIAFLVFSISILVLVVAVAVIVIVVNIVIESTPVHNLNQSFSFHSLSILVRWIAHLVGYFFFFFAFLVLFQFYFSNLFQTFDIRLRKCDWTIVWNKIKSHINFAIHPAL